MTTRLPLLTQIDIQQWVGSTSFQKGMSYFSRGFIYETRRQGQSLKARCRGSQADSYQLQVILSPTGIASASCSCPVGSGGHCKHVAALLLTWVDAPTSFKEIDDLTVTLEKRSKADLIALIQLMVQRDPDLEMLLEIPLPGSEAGDKPVDAQVIRKQANHAFRSSRGEYELGWGDPYEIVEELQSLFDLAEQYRAQNNPSNAAIIYREVAATLLDYKDAVMGDDDGHLIAAFDDCAVGLEECLETIANSDQRESILKVLFDIYALDLKIGGIGLGDTVPGILLEQTTLQEKEMISDWIETALTGMRDWARAAIGGLLLDLRAGALDDESFLKICYRTGRLDDLVDRLLTLKRTDEAVENAGQAGDYDLLRLADLFVRHGQGPLAETLVRDRIKTSQDTRLIGWLKEYAKNQGDLVQALAFAEKMFWIRPTVEAYVEMRRLAQPQKQWPGLRTKTLESLDQKGEQALLTEIFLEEGQIDQALESLERARGSNFYWGGGFALKIKVAQAASKPRPRESIRLYMQLVESLIQQRGRGNYVQAAGYLRIVRETYAHLGEPQSWQELIAALREQNRNLPALREELNRAGL